MLLLLIMPQVVPASRQPRQDRAAVERVRTRASHGRLHVTRHTSHVTRHTSLAIKQVKSHVAADWISSCLATGTAHARTDGLEQRQVTIFAVFLPVITFLGHNDHTPQFLHVDDVAAALLAMMMHHEQLQVRACRSIQFGATIDACQAVSDVTSNEWISMRDFAAAVGRVAPCRVLFNESNTVHRACASSAARAVLLAPCVCFCAHLLHHSLSLAYLTEPPACDVLLIADALFSSLDTLTSLPHRLLPGSTPSRRIFWREMCGDRACCWTKAWRWCGV
jgi:hypothetical protein